MLQLEGDAADALYTGLATHLVDDDDRDTFVAAIGSEGLAAALERFTLDRSAAGESAVERHIERIESVFSRETAQEMIAALESGEQDEWATAPGTRPTSTPWTPARSVRRWPRADRV